MQRVLCSFIQILRESELPLILQMHHFHSKSLIMLVEIVNQGSDIIEILKQLFHNQKHMCEFLLIIALDDLHLQYLFDFIDLLL